MEGKAPSAEIQGAFFRFRKWLMAVYRHIRNLRVELNDEVREVFGRMIAAEHETGMAAAEYGLLGLTPDEMKALGMTRTQQDYARKLTEAALDVAATKLAQARNRERRQRKKEYQETAAEELAMKPVYMARDAMLETPLDAELVATLYGESTLEALQETHRGGVQAGTGVDPEIFAASQGFESRAKMISELLDAPQKSVAIRQRAEAMEQQYAASFSATDYLLESEQLREQAALVGTYLSRQLGRQRVQQEVLGAVVQQELANMPLGKAMQEKNFLAAVRRATRAERLAISKGDFATALEVNTRARLNLEFARQSKDITSRFNRLRREIKRFCGMNAADPAARFYAMILGTRYGLINYNERLAERVGFERFPQHLVIQTFLCISLKSYTKRYTMSFLIRNFSQLK